MGRIVTPSFVCLKSFAFVEVMSASREIRPALDEHPPPFDSPPTVPGSNEKDAIIRASSQEHGNDPEKLPLGSSVPGVKKVERFSHVLYH